VVEVLLAFRASLLAWRIVERAEPGMNNVMIAVGLSAVPNYARLVRASVLAAARAATRGSARGELGSRDLSIVSPLHPAECRRAAHCEGHDRLGTRDTSAAALSFLGLGSQPPQPEWVRLLTEGARLPAEAGGSRRCGLGIMLDGGRE